MNTKSVAPDESPQIALDPRLRYLRGRAQEILRQFALSHPTARPVCQDRAAELSHLLTQVVVPMARDAGQAFLTRALEDIASSMQRLAGADAFDAFQFPLDDGRQRVEDKLDEILLTLRAVLKRRGKRVFHVVELDPHFDGEAA